MRCRDLAVILLGLSKEFNIDRFLYMFLEALVDCRWETDCYFQLSLYLSLFLCKIWNWWSFIRSSSDELCHLALVSILETVPVKDLVSHVVCKVLLSCMKLAQKIGNSGSSESGMLLSYHLFWCFTFTEQVYIVITQAYEYFSIFSHNLYNIIEFSFGDCFLRYVVLLFFQVILELLYWIFVICYTMILKF